MPKKSFSGLAEPPNNLSGYNPLRDCQGFTWEPAAAAHVIEFFSEVLKLTSGRMAGKSFALPAWQRDFVATLYGWKRPDGSRRYREGLVFVPRKNGKTETGAGLALYALCCDREAKPEIYSAAKTRDQASRVFEPAAIMVRNSQMLAQRLRVIQSQKRIVNPANDGYYTAIAADAATAHGKNPHHVLFDELHTQPHRDLYDGLKSGMGARQQPMFLSLTTAGFDRNSICYEVWKYAQQVRDGVVCDPTFLPVLYQYEDGDDWEDENVWRRTNPNLDVTTTMDFLRAEFERARQIPAYENTFRNLYLNQWTEQAERWFSLESWDNCKSDIEPVYGSECYIGLDLSSTKDLSALAMVFPTPSGVVVRCKFWVPTDSAREREHRDRVPYRQWMDDGWITGTNGSTVDYDHIRHDLLELSRQYWVKTVAIDPWNANQLAHQLQSDGLNVKFCGQGFASLSGPSKELERLLLDREFFHDGNPVLRWCANNVSLRKDPAGNIKPDKSTSSERIDGVVAVIMGLGAMAEHLQTWTPSEMGL